MHIDFSSFFTLTLELLVSTFFSTTVLKDNQSSLIQPITTITCARLLAGRELQKINNVSLLVSSWAGCTMFNSLLCLSDLYSCNFCPTFWLWLISNCHSNLAVKAFLAIETKTLITFHPELVLNYCISFLTTILTRSPPSNECLTPPFQYWKGCQLRETLTNRIRVLLPIIAHLNAPLSILWPTVEVILSWIVAR